MYTSFPGILTSSSSFMTSLVENHMGPGLVKSIGVSCLGPEWLGKQISREQQPQHLYPPRNIIGMIMIGMSLTIGINYNGIIGIIADFNRDYYGITPQKFNIDTKNGHN